MSAGEPVRMQAISGCLTEAASHAAEWARQQALLAALQGQAAPGVPQLAGLPGRQAGPPLLQEGLGAYRANAKAIAERALAAAYPVVQQLLGEESFAALAWALWRQQPPLRGDLAWFGEGLHLLLQAGTAELGEPCLPDVARLEWAVHRAQFAQDHGGPPQGLHWLAEAEPDTVWVRFAPGTALVASAHPVAAIWLAHQSEKAGEGDARFADVRAAFAAKRAEAALAWRRGWRVTVAALAPAEAGFTACLLAGHTLGHALSQAAEGFSFEAWLVRALSDGWLAGLQTTPTEEGNPT